MLLPSDAPAAPFELRICSLVKFEQRQCILKACSNHCDTVVDKFPLLDRSCNTHELRLCEFLKPLKLDLYCSDTIATSWQFVNPDGYVNIKFVPFTTQHWTYWVHCSELWKKSIISWKPPTLYIIFVWKAWFELTLLYERYLILIAG